MRGRVAGGVLNDKSRQTKRASLTKRLSPVLLIRPTVFCVKTMQVTLYIYNKLYL